MRSKKSAQMLFFVKENHKKAPDTDVKALFKN